MGDRTLAPAYAQAHPERVIGCVLRGVFLGRAIEVDWFLHGLAAVFPDAHAAFVGFLPEDERHDVLAGYLRRLIDPDPAVHLRRPAHGRSIKDRAVRCCRARKRSAPLPRTAPR